MKSSADKASGNPAWSALSDPNTGLTAQAHVNLCPVLLVAHPDDETIGASTIIGRLRDPAIAYLTDGAPLDRQFWSPDATGSREEYASLRRQEAIHAMAIAGIPAERVFFLGGIDQDSVQKVGPLVRHFTELVRRVKPDLVVTQPYEGGHPDHDTAALVAQLTGKALERSGENPPELIEMTSYHVARGGCVTGEFLQNDPAASAEIVVELSFEERARKQQMIEAFHSQRLVLSGFQSEQERFRRAPAYKFADPPHPGKLWYEYLGWPMTAEHWRQVAARELAQFGEAACV